MKGRPPRLPHGGVPRPHVSRAGGNGDYARRLYTKAGVEIGAASGDGALILVVVTVDGIRFGQFQRWCKRMGIGCKFVQNIGTQKNVAEVWANSSTDIERVWWHDNVVNMEWPMSTRLPHCAAGGGEKPRKDLTYAKMNVVAITDSGERYQVRV